MNSNESLRNHLLKILDWQDAHVNFDASIDNVPPELRGVQPEGMPHSLWQLLEHLRICQLDILDFCRNPDYVEMKMEHYWPSTVAPPSDGAWNESIAGFRDDLESMKRLALDQNIDLFAEIPHGAGQTYLREILLVADHNAYHVGQIVATRRLLGIW
jgi:uncharacterized damage-inducible protein DinB